MRTLFPLLAVPAMLLGATACTSKATFQGISSVKVRHIGEGGLKDKVFKEAAMEELIACLYTTTEVTEEETKRELLQTTYLIEISDNLGDRSFELYTDENIKGNKGKYYVNTCIHELIKAAK
jgi:predicted ATPase